MTALLWPENLKSFKRLSINTLCDLRGCIKSVNVLYNFTTAFSRFIRRVH